MGDTSFGLARENAGRFSKLYEYDGKGDGPGRSGRGQSVLGEAGRYLFRWWRIAFDCERLSQVRGDAAAGR